MHKLYLLLYLCNKCNSDTTLQFRNFEQTFPHLFRCSVHRKEEGQSSLVLFCFLLLLPANSLVLLFFDSVQEQTSLTVSQQLLND